MAQKMHPLMLSKRVRGGYTLLFRSGYVSTLADPVIFDAHMESINVRQVVDEYKGEVVSQNEKVYELLFET